MRFVKNSMVGIFLTLMILLNISFASATIESNESIDEKWDTSPQEAYRVSNAVRVHHMADGMYGLEDWHKATLDPNPEIIYDMNGKRLYYEFFVKNSSGIIGSMKVNANKTRGYAIKTFESGSNLEYYETSKKKAISIISDKYPNKEIVSTKLVYYSISQMGISATLRDISTGNENNIIIDLYSFEEIPQNRTCSKLDLPENRTYSSLNLTAKELIERNLLKWNINVESADEIEQIAAKSNIDISKPLSERDLKEIKLKFDEAEIDSMKKLNEYISKKRKASGIQYNTLLANTLRSTPDEKILYDVHCKTQKNSYYCAPTSAQMIAEYYGVTHSQDHIYAMMDGTSPNGISVQKSLLYYKAPSPDGLNKPNSEVRNDPDFLYSMYEIYHDRPFVSCVHIENIVSDYGHARVCKGYKKDSQGNYLRIADPTRNLFTVKDRWVQWEDEERTHDVFVK